MSEVVEVGNDGEGMHSNDYKHYSDSQRVIVTVRDIEEVPIIHVGEAIRFFRWLKKEGYMQQRIYMGTLCDAGLRPAEGGRLALNNIISPDYNKLKYLVRKYRFCEYESGTHTYRFKSRTVTLCSILAAELKHYVETLILHTKQSPGLLDCRKHIDATDLPKEFMARIFMYDESRHENNSIQLWKMDEEGLRQFLYKLRKRALKGKIDDPVVAKLVTDTLGRSVINIGAKANKVFRLHPHSFRHFYVCYCYYIKYGHPDPNYLTGDWVRTQLDIGHNLKRTTMEYIEQPEHFGLTPEIKRLWQKHGNNLIFGGGFDVPLDSF